MNFRNCFMHREQRNCLWAGVFVCLIVHLMLPTVNEYTIDRKITILVSTSFFNERAFMPRITGFPIYLTTCVTGCKIKQEKAWNGKRKCQKKVKKYSWPSRSSFTKQSSVQCSFQCPFRVCCYKRDTFRLNSTRAFNSNITSYVSRSRFSSD